MIKKELQRSYKGTIKVLQAQRIYSERRYWLISLGQSKLPLVLQHAECCKRRWVTEEQSLPSFLEKWSGRTGAARILHKANVTVREFVP